VIMRVRPFAAEDLEAVLVIEQQAFATPWTRRMFEESVQSPGVAMVVMERATQILGYACVRIVLDEAELLTIAVARTAQRQGIGKALLQWGITHAHAAQVRHMFLEVRASNHSAQQLYVRCGFEALGVRRAYYNSPTEDAIIMGRHFHDGD